jgi:enoyl-CoA hydratase
MLITTDGAIGKVTFARQTMAAPWPLAQITELSTALENWARDPAIYCIVLDAGNQQDSAGGQHAMPVAPALITRDASERLRQELLLIWQFDRFPKPAIVIMDELWVGLPLALAVWATHRVMSPAASLAVPEIAHGHYLQRGLARRLAALSGGMGAYLALTGRPLDAGAALRAGLATHCFATTAKPIMQSKLAQADCVDPVLDDLHQEPAPDAAGAIERLIADVFPAGTLVEIRRQLSRIEGEFRPWARRLLADLDELDQDLVAHTLRQIERAKGQQLPQTLIDDFRQMLGLHAAGLIPIAAGAPRPSLARPDRPPLDWPVPPSGDLQLPERNFIPSVPA